MNRNSDGLKFRMLHSLRPFIVRRLSVPASTSRSVLDDIVNDVVSDGAARRTPVATQSNSMLKPLVVEKDFVNFVKGTNLTGSNLNFLCEQMLKSKVDPRKAVQYLSQDKEVQISSFSASECVSVAAFLIKLKAEKLKLFDAVMQRWEEIITSKTDAAAIEISVDILFRLMSAIGDRKEKGLVAMLPTECNKFLTQSIIDSLSSLPKTADIFTVLKHFHHFAPNRDWLPACVERAAKQIDIMQAEEAEVLLRHLANIYFQDRTTKVLPRIAQRIASRATPFSINQLVSLASSAATLNFADARLLRVIADDLCMEINNLESLNDASSLVNSFNRLRIGHDKAWNLLATWVNRNAATMPLKFLSITVANFFFAGIDKAKEAAHQMALKVDKRLVSTPHIWLTSMHSLAYFDELTPELAETVLGKAFLNETVFSEEAGISEKVHLASMILQIQAYVLKKYGDSYKGPRVERKQLAGFLDTEDAKAAAYSKYGKRKDVVRATVRDDGLLKIATTNRVGPPHIDESGAFSVARIVLDDQFFMKPMEQWGNEVPRPILYMGETQLLRNIDGNNSKSLIGREKMVLRLLAANGIKPIVIFEQDMSRLSSLPEKVDFLSSLLKS